MALLTHDFQHGERIRVHVLFPTVFLNGTYTCMSSVEKILRYIDGLTFPRYLNFCRGVTLLFVVNKIADVGDVRGHGERFRRDISIIERHCEGKWSWSLLADCSWRLKGYN